MIFIHFDMGAPSSFSFQASYWLYTTDPTRSLPVQYSVTLNSAGEVTPASAGGGGGCGG